MPGCVHLRNLSRIIFKFESRPWHLCIIAGELMRSNCATARRGHAR
jgi:hypothetical protein